MSQIPGPGYGPLEGAVENHGTQSIGVAGRPANTCATCNWAMPIAPGYAIVCGEKWRRLEWHEAAPLTSAGEVCDKHELRSIAPHGRESDG